MREEYNQTIHRSTEEKYVDKNQENHVRGKQSNPVGNEQTMEVLREEKQLRFCLWMKKQQEGRELEVREPSAQSWREEDLHERMNSKIMGRVCVWVRTDSPATPLPRP